jgi:L-alanine-DL-glutamate epimerase-like enolase superfamily enzyme
VTDREWSRRKFLTVGGSTAILNGLFSFAAAETRRTKISDIQTMTISGARTYVFVKVVSDDGHFGIAEAYGTPSIGVKEQIEALKPLLVGKNPLEIDAIYTYMGIGGPELSGTLTHACGQRYRDGVVGSGWKAAWGSHNNASGRTVPRPSAGIRPRGAARYVGQSFLPGMGSKVKEDPSGFTAHKFGFPHTDAATDGARDPGNRVLTTKELREIAQGFENCREAIGWDHDIMVHCHWEYDLRTSIQLAEAVAPIKPMWLEDPLTVDYSESWRRLCASSQVPICTGENLERRAGFKDLIIYQGCDILNPDLRNSGGFLETKRIADMADTFGLPMATHKYRESIAHLGELPMGRVHPGLHRL